MFEIKEVSKVEATGSLWCSAISCLGTWTFVAFSGVLLLAKADNYLALNLTRRI